MKIMEMLKGDKKPGIGIYILLLAGAALLAFGSVPKKGNSEAPPAETVPAVQNYVAELQNGLEDILSSIEGAGKVRVLLVARDSGSVEVGKDGSGENSKTVVLNKQGGSEALVLAENFPTVKGAVIVADGAGSDRVRADLAQAASAALGIGIHRVKVYKRAK